MGDLSHYVVFVGVNVCFAWIGMSAWEIESFNFLISWETLKMEIVLLEGNAFGFWQINLDLILI